MRRRVKRRLFLMSMALATGATGSAFGKGFGKGEDELRLHSDERGSAHVSALPDEDGGGSGGKAGAWLGKLKGLLGGMQYGAEAGSPSPRESGWRLEMLPAEGKSEHPNELRLDRAKRLGVAFRLSF
jgi:hypothetical protein